MKITEFALRRPVTVLIFTIALIVFGAYSYMHMGVESMPNVEFPIVLVRTNMTGASPSIMDNDVTDVLEARINTIEGIKNLTSSSYEGMSFIVVEFELDRDVDDAAADVRGKVSMATNALPDECDVPMVDKYDPTNWPIMNIAVRNDGRTDSRTLTKFVDKVVSERLQTAKGVGNVTIMGFRDREIRVWLNTNSMEAYRLTTKDIKNAIYSKHVDLPAGRIETGTKEYGIRLEGEYSSVAELSYIPVAVRNGTVIRLKDIARIEDDFEDKRRSSLYENEPTIVVQVRKQKGANEVELSRQVREKIKSLNEIAPPGTEMFVLQDNAKFIINSMNGVLKDIILSVILTSVIMFVFLRTLKATLVAVVTIPVCLLGSLSVLYWMGITINNMSMMGLSLAVGMVVDATTVVMENITRHRDMGKTAYRAADEGAGEVGFAVIAGAATTLAVFVPVAFMGGLMGRFFNAFGTTVATTISISLLVSLTLTPFLCSRILGRKKRGKLADALEAPFLWLEKRYRTALVYAVGHRKTVILTALSLFAGGLFLAASLGTEFFPSEDRGILRVRLELPADSSLELTESVMKEMTETVRMEKGVAYTYADAGGGMGGETYKGTINIELADRDDRPSSSVIMGMLRKRLLKFRDVDIKLGTWGGSDIELVILGPSPEALAELGEKIKKDLEKNQKGLVDITTDLQMNKPRINLTLNRALADEMNINIRELSSELETWFGGTDAGTFNEGGSKYDIHLRAESRYRDDPKKVLNTLVTTMSSGTMRAEGLVTSSIGMAPNVVKRYNRQHSIDIGANVDGISPGEGIALMEETFRRYAPKDGTYSIEPSGDSEHMRESFKYLFTALIFAIILVYMVMAVQFESFLHPFTVMFSLPLMTAGSFGLLTLAGLRLSVMSHMGIILLVGVVVNNAILLVDFINQLRAKGLNKTEAVITAGPLRLRAILMTTVSTMAGSLPVALALSEGGEVRQPMSVAVIGGLFTSTLLTLLVIPVVYLILDDVADRAKGGIKRYRAYLRLKEKRAAAAGLVLLLLFASARELCAQPRPLAIGEAVAVTLDNNAELRSLREERAKAKAFRLRADGAWLPAAGINAYIDKQKEDTVTDGSGRSDSRAASLALEQTIYSGGRDSAVRRQSRQVANIAELAVLDGENRAVGELFARFYNVILQTEKVAAEMSAVKRSELYLQEVRKMSELGLANRLEVIRAAQQLARDTANLTTAKGLREAARISLMNYMGMPHDAYAEVEGRLEIPSVSGSRAESVASAEEHRADLALLKERIERRKNQIDEKKSAVRPKASLKVSGGYLDPYRGRDDLDDTWRAELSISVPIFDRNAARADVMDAAASLNQDNIALEQKKLDIRAQVETAWTEIESTAERSAASGKALELAEETLRLAAVGYKEGVTPQLDLLDAQTSLTSARLDFVSSQYNHLVAVIALKTTEGTLKDFVEEGNF